MAETARFGGRFRKSLLVGGTLLVFIAAETLEWQRTLSGPPVDFLRTLLEVLVTAGFLFMTGWRGANGRYPFLHGALAALLFLFHADVLSQTHRSDRLPFAADALFVSAFLAAWSWTDHWSLFMRSFALAGVYAAGLWMGTPFTVWALLAMVPWLIFNRRPIAALGSWLAILLGGLAIYSVSWGAVWLALFRNGAPPPFFSNVAEGVRLGFVSELAVRPDDLLARWTFWEALTRITLPWMLIVLATTSRRLTGMVTQRRADMPSFAAALSWVAAGLCLFGGWFGRWLWGGEFAVLVAAAAPLAAQEWAQRDFLFHRGVRITAVAAWLAGLAAAWPVVPHAWVASAAAIAIAAAAASAIPSVRRTPWRLRAPALLMGAYGAVSTVVFIRLVW